MRFEHTNPGRALPPRYYNNNNNNTDNKSYARTTHRARYVSPGPVAADTQFIVTFNIQMSSIPGRISGGRS